MKKVFLLLVGILTIFSCSNDDDSSNNNELDGNVFYEQNIDEYYAGFMDYEDGTYPLIGSIQDNADYIVDLIYDGNKITARIGDFYPLDAAGGINNYFTNDIYDELKYTNNSIKIERKHNPNPNFNPASFDNNEREIILENNYMKQKISKYNGNIIDTTSYYYDSNNRVIESIRKHYVDNGSFIYYNSKDQANYYYDNSSNLDSIITTKYDHNDEFEWPVTKETFSDYDTSENPIKNLIIFSETFYRSLSQNNYRYYKKEYIYNDVNAIPNYLIRTWSFIYDSDGNIRYD